MKLYLASGALDDVLWATRRRLVDVHPLTDRGVDRFLHALSRQHGTWSLV